ncbi:hypothetical protein OSTOST_20223 [Ostertagia ostertagi]
MIISDFEHLRWKEAPPDFAIFDDAHIIALIDKSIGNALKVMRNHPERFENEINNDVNNFIKSSRRAKPVLLDAMIAYACIPDCWGGIYYDKTVTARLAESKSQTVDTQKTEAATKKEEEGKKGTEAKEQKDQKGEGEKNEGTTDKIWGEWTVDHGTHREEHYGPNNWLLPSVAPCSAPTQ